MKNKYFYTILFLASILINCNKENSSNKNYARGEELYKMYCIACHSLDGSNEEKFGPTFKGLYLKDRELTNGKMVVADEGYLRRSIVEPKQEVPVAFKRVVMNPMGDFLSEDEIDFLINFIKEQK